MGWNDAEHVFRIEHQVTDCVTSISDLYFAPNHTLVYSVSNRTRSLSASVQNISTGKDITGRWMEVLLERLHRLGRWPVLVSGPATEVLKHDNTDYRDTANDDKHGSYILTTEYFSSDKNEVLHDITENIQRLESYSAWNPRSRFVVVVVALGEVCDIEIMVQELLKALWKWKIIDIVILTAMISDKNNDLNIYSWFPYHPPSGICGQMMETVLLDTWVSNGTSGFLRRNTHLFQEKIPNKMSGCPLRVEVAHFPPYIIFHKSNSVFENVPTFIGLDINMVRTISEVMDMSLELSPMYDKYPWGRYVNGTWFGLRGGLAYDRTDIALDAWSINLEDYSLFQGTERYFTDQVTWYVPSARIRPRWMSIARVFARNTWIVFFFSIFVSSAVFWGLALTRSKFKSSHRYRNIFNCFFDSWAVVLGVSTSEIVYFPSLRFFFISWVIYSLSVSNVFQTFFISYLVDPGLEHGINNIEELVDSELDVVLSVYLASFFDEKLLKDRNRRTVVDTPFECLQKVTDEGSFATMLSRVYFMSAGSEFIDRGQKLNLSPFKEDVYSNHIFMLLKKGSCLLDRINDVIFRVVEAGLPDKFLKEILDTDRHNSNPRSLKDVSEDYVSMSVSHLQSAFFLLCLGTVLSIITFIIEISYSNCGQRRELGANNMEHKATQESK
jgi:hypothetical protein